MARAGLWLWGCVDGGETVRRGENLEVGLLKLELWARVEVETGGAADELELSCNLG